MGADEYLQSILYREAVDTGPLSPERGVQAALYPTISEWANRFLLGVHPSGSFMKGTANKRGTDIDLFISVSELAVESLQQIYQTLFTRLRDKGYAPTQQNVTINVRVNGYSVDLVPGKRQGSYGGIVQAVIDLRDSADAFTSTGDALTKERQALWNARAQNFGTQMEALRNRSPFYNQKIQ